MAETVRSADIATRWGPAERAAIDRCAFLPRMPFGLREPNRPPRLTRLIETEIIPRLMLTHRSEYDDTPEEAARRLDVSDVAEIAGLAMGSVSDAALERVRAFFDQGVSLEAVILDGLAPAARLLGDMWRDDLCTFADVTIGMSRLQQVLRGLEPDAVPDEPAERILLGSISGDQHGFGLAVLEGFFRRAGWDVSAGHPAEDLGHIVRDEWFDVVGLSVSCDIFVDHVAPTIRSLRRASKNKNLFVMVGGRYFLDNPDRAAAFGADAVSSDANDALRRAHDRRGAPVARC